MRFCRICGTNLQGVAPPVTAQSPPVYAPNMVNQYEAGRQRESSKALRMALIGGGLLAYKFFSFVLSGNSPFGPLMVFGFILLAMGISKMASQRTPYPAYPPMEASRMPVEAAPPQASLPQPVFSSMATSETPSRNTNELEPIPQPLGSVTEEETRHLNR
ncbi:MAG: hypothetical protein SF339_23485 [Blastocatellia bacterium]|nr:hypothetical protein [Blastocatellia bacterium]